MLNGTEQRPWSPRLRGRTVRWAGLAVALLVSVVVGGRWYATSARAFDTTPSLSGRVSEIPPGTVASWTAGTRLPPVKVTSAEVVLDDSSGLASTGASLCVAGSTFGGVRGDLSQFCRDVLPLAGADLSKVPADSYLTVSVAATTTATVRLVGIRVAFEQGWRTGEQTIPIDVTVVPASR